MSNTGHKPTPANELIERVRKEMHPGDMVHGWELGLGAACIIAQAIDRLTHAVNRNTANLRPDPLEARDVGAESEEGCRIQMENARAARRAARDAEDI
jgi:hypothetical protein